METLYESDPGIMPVPDEGDGGFLENTAEVMELLRQGEQSENAETVKGENGFEEDFEDGDGGEKGGAAAHKALEEGHSPGDEHREEAEQGSAVHTGGNEERDHKTRDFLAELTALYAKRPDLRGKEIPKEVFSAVTANGEALENAWLSYEAHSANRELSELRRENSALKKAMEDGKRFPVKGGAGKIAPRKHDPFLEGFDSDRW